MTEDKSETESNFEESEVIEVESADALGSCGRSYQRGRGLS
jgi:hypothetical protein